MDIEYATQLKLVARYEAWLEQIDFTDEGWQKLSGTIDRFESIAAVWESDLRLINTLKTI